MKPVSRPPGIFTGNNFMTPRILGYYKLAFGLGYAELSEGTGFKQEPIFGVTVRPKPADRTDDKSKLCFSRQEAERYIESLS